MIQKELREIKSFGPALRDGQFRKSLRHSFSWNGVNPHQFDDSEACTLQHGLLKSVEEELGSISLSHFVNSINNRDPKSERARSDISFLISAGADTDGSRKGDSSLSNSHDQKPQVITIDTDEKVASNLHSRVRRTQQSWFTVYKSLFLAAFSVNMSLLVAATTGRFAHAQSRAALFSIANILALILCRNEVFLHCIFMLAVSVLKGHRNSPLHTPLCVKVVVTSLLQNLGGIHSGCGLSSIFWLSYAISKIGSSSPSQVESQAIMSIAITVLLLLLASCLTAFPALRHLHHNVFKRVHRFTGWTALALIWIYTVYANRRSSSSVSRTELYFTAVITFFIILPWLCMRRVVVQTIIPSNKTVSIIKFQGAGIKPGLLARISRSPLSEWHAFGVISDGEKGHMVLAGGQSDFTQELVAKPPTHIWIRCVHFAGLPYLASMYENVLFVAKGSGICVFLSFLLQQTKTQIYIIWVAKTIQKTYGSDITDIVQNYPASKRTVIDTEIEVRPNVEELVVRTVVESSAEVVIVSSNPCGSKSVVDACRARNIAAFSCSWEQGLQVERRRVQDRGGNLLGSEYPTLWPHLGLS